MRIRRKRRRALIDRARALIGAELGSRALGAFERMGIAEAELERFGGREHEPQGIFLALAPTPALDGAPARLYRAHVRELVERAIAGVDLRPGTDAEILCSYLEASLRAPLNGEAAAVAERLFASVAPELAAELFGDPFREAWPGQVDDTIADFRRRFRAPDRKV